MFILLLVLNSLLFLISVFLLVIFFIVGKKLKEGRAKLNAGRREFNRWDQWYIRLLASRKLEEGRRQLFWGEKKYDRYRLIHKLILIVAIFFFLLSIAILSFLLFSFL